MTMRCRSVRRNLSAFLDDELAPAVADAMRDHLRGCAPCASAFEALRAADADAGGALRRAAEGLRPSAAFTGRVLGASAADETKGVLRRRARFRLVAFGTAAAVLVGVGLWGLLQSRPPGEVSSHDNVTPKERRADGIVMTSLDLPSVRDLVDELLGPPGDPGGHQGDNGPQINRN